ncbi:deep-sea actinoporin Cjtox I-like [Paramisgurnus dabryanus]|uniref:deep-sea actinoporin Cjtox I-like n=1 Tax=Paramisgurnus dabryanus TaxID=90735 RepID=UPI0031F3F499
MSAESVSARLDTNRNCTIEIDNKSNNYNLINPQVYMYHGFNHTILQPTIGARSISVCAFTKTPNTACGSIGVLTYDLFDMKNQRTIDRMALLFSVPYNFNFYDNIFAIGLITTARQCNEALYNDMYYGKGNFNRAEAKKGGLTYTLSNVELRATMSNMAKAIIKLQIYDR